MVTKQEFTDRIEYLNENGDYHRLDGPAVSWNDGTNFWFINGQNHREDGHAIEYNNGSVSFYLNDIRYSEQEWQDKVIKIKLERLKNYGN